ncbi:hypothetical protein EDB19DRAFT_1710835 [Suillus lakei]|nr:hypothetical protein EDB19DRAFT_1710835 [Suillus lakei]
MATLWSYDYACSLHEEWTFLLRSRWTKVKSLYIITRYVPFLLLVTELYRALSSGTHPTDYELRHCKCRMVISIYSFFFVLRTYALWDNNRIVLAAMLSALLVITMSAIPGITGCYRTLSGVQIFAICFLLVFAFQLGLVSLTLIRALQSWRTVNGPLYDILVKHNVFYYTCGLRKSGHTHISVLININDNSSVNVVTEMVFSQYVPPNPPANCWQQHQTRVQSAVRYARDPRRAHAPLPLAD